VYRLPKRADRVHGEIVPIAKLEKVEEMKADKGCVTGNENEELRTGLEKGKGKGRVGQGLLKQKPFLKEVLA
nr:hypothetical protein [Tanacetum cinerariifolium]